MAMTNRNVMKTLSGAAIAATAAGTFLFGTTSTVVSAEKAKVHCVGVNGCKGHSDCKTASNECKGQNACKGKGFVETSEKQCIEKGGAVDKN